MKHTKGDWNIEENVNHYPFIMGDDNNLIAKLIDEDGSLFQGRSYEETLSNASIISASPKMLQALIEVQEFLDHIQPSVATCAFESIYDTVREAIDEAAKRYK